MVCLCAKNANKDTWGCSLADDSSSDSCICFALTKKKKKKSFKRALSNGSWVENLERSKTHDVRGAYQGIRYLEENVS